jgi:Domain of unknown function (DUF4296)
MKKFTLIIALVFIISCNSVVEKPDNLIDEDQMVDMIYDISLLDAMKSQGVVTQVTYPTTTQFIKSKYKVDSLTFAKSSQYYAADYKKYKKMYEEVKQRLEEETKKINGGNPTTPDPNQGIVK